MRKELKELSRGKEHLKGEHFRVEVEVRVLDIRYNFLRSNNDNRKNQSNMQQVREENIIMGH